jgi:hypothetical protein
VPVSAADDAAVVIVTAIAEFRFYCALQVRALPVTKWQRSIWLFCEEPDSSPAARVFAVVSVVCILISITNFCTETLPMFERPLCRNITSDGGLTYYEIPNYSDPFFMVETACVTWFTVEFMLRYVSCPSKYQFCRGLMNIFDMLAIMPYFIILAVQQIEGNCESAKRSGSFIFIRVLRVFRIFKLSKHSQVSHVARLRSKNVVFNSSVCRVKICMRNDAIKQVARIS